MLVANKKLLVLFLFTCIFTLGTVDAGVHKCQNANGQTIFQDRPCQNPGNTEPARAEKSSASVSDKHFLWKAQSNTSTIHLLGSLHFGSTEMFPLPTVITDAYDSSDTLIVEVNADQQKLKEASDILIKTGTYIDGSNLQDHISAKTWEQVSNTAELQKLDINRLKVQKPWLICFTLAALSIERSGFSPKLGIDRYFITGATDKKPILELETVSEQMELLSHFSSLEQDKLLEETLKQLEQGPTYFRSMLVAWQTGDTNKMEELTRKNIDTDEDGKRIYKVIFTDRNHSMVEKILKYAEPGKSLFVVVGAGHMVGSEGIVELLRTQGYEITQL